MITPRDISINIIKEHNKGHFNKNMHNVDKCNNDMRSLKITITLQIHVQSRVKEVRLIMYAGH